MSEGVRRVRLGRLVRSTVLAAILVGALVALALPASGFGRQAKSNATCELSVFSWWTGGGEAAGLDKLIKIWNKQHADCKFKNETVAGGAGTNAKAVLAQRLAAGNPPDSFQGHAGAELRDYIKAGQILPVDFIYKQAGFGKIMPASLINQIRYKGKLYSVPVNIHRANVLWYNPKALKQAGIKAPNPNTSYSWAQFIAALQKAQDAGLIPLAMGEQWTAQHLLETVMIGTLGPRGWAALWTPNSTSRWASKKVTTALNRYNTLLGYTNSDAGSLTWQNAGKLVADGKAAFNVMGDWQDGYFSGSKAGDNLAFKPGKDYGWTAVPGTSGVYDWLSDSFTLPKGAPHRPGGDPVADLPRGQAGAGHVQPGQGLDPGPEGRESEAVRPVLEVGAQAVEDRRARRIAHPWSRCPWSMGDGHRDGTRPVPADQGRGEVPGRAREGGEEELVVEKA